MSICIMERKEDLMLGKKQTRGQIKGLFKDFSFEDNQRRSNHVTQRLLSLEVYREAGSILFYASLQDEVETISFLRQQLSKKKILLPRVNGQLLDVYSIRDAEKDLQKAAFGIVEPKRGCEKKSVSDVDIVLVPGVAYDREKNRLGRGRGYYDRFLKTLPDEVKKIGLCFSFQILDSLPHDSGDERVDLIVTDEEII